MKIGNMRIDLRHTKETALLDAARIIEELTKDHKGAYYKAKVAEYRRIANEKGARRG